MRRRIGPWCVAGAGFVAALFAPADGGGPRVVRAQQARPAAGPFAWFSPVLTVSPEQQRRLDRGEVLVESLPAVGRHVGFFTAIAVRAEPHVFLDRLRDLPAFRQSRPVPIMRVFSAPPRVEDLAELDMPPDDLEDLRGCRPGNCDLKLTEAEIVRLRAVLDAGGARWQPAVQRTFREIVLDRLRAYERAGLAALGPYASTPQPTDLGDRFVSLLDQAALLRDRLPGVAAYLRRYPDAEPPAAASSFYWAIEDLRKLVLTVRHVLVLQNPGGEGMPEVVAVDKQLFALHYVDAQLSVSAVVRGTAGRNYFVHLHYAEIDLLDGFMAWVRRLLIERGVEQEAQSLLPEVKRRLERRAAELTSAGRPGARRP
jgi:hypothetical protein